MKNLEQTLNKSNSNFIFEAGLHAYYRNDYKLASEYFLNSLKRDQRNWNARLYLGMCYTHFKQFGEAMEQFELIEHSCTDVQLKNRAILAGLALNSICH